MQKPYSLQKQSLAPPEILTDAWLPSFSPVVLSWVERGSSSAGSPLYLQMRYGKTMVVFRTVYRKGWQERDFQAALAALEIPEERREGTSVSRTRKHIYPLMVLPYLSEDKLAELERRQISGIDLCGNGLIVVPERWLIRSVGQPNRFRVEQSLRNPYAGKAALVGRALLSSPLAPKLEDLHRFIAGQGGEISLALVSRAVQRLEEDVIVRAHQGFKVWLVQPEKLLHALERGYEKQRGTLLWQGRIEGNVEVMLATLFANAQTHRLRLMMTGLSSVTRYVTMAMENTLRVYVNPATPPETLLQGMTARPGSVFPTLEIYTSPDPTVFFESVVEENLIWASPLQTYLEMRQSGDVRLEDSAVPLKARLLEEVERVRTKLLLMQQEAAW